MSKLVKDLMMRDYRERLEGIEGALAISIRGIPANENNELRQDLLTKNIHITVVRNNLVKHVCADSPLEAISPALKGPTALAYGAESVVDVARELIEWAKKVEQLELKGAVLEGEYYDGESGVERLSKMPTREEALSQVITLFLSPGKNLAGAVGGPGGGIAGVLKAIEEKLEKGETIEKVG